MTGTDTCAMCGNRPADHGLMCAQHRAEDAAIHANDNRAPIAFSDDVDPGDREPKEMS